MPASKIITIEADHLRSMCKIIESVTDKRSPSRASSSTSLTVDEDGSVRLKAQSRLAVVDLVATAEASAPTAYHCWVGSEMLCAFAKQLRGRVEVRLRAKDIVLQGGPTYRLPHVEVDEPEHLQTDALWSMKAAAPDVINALRVAAAFTDGDDTRGLGGVGLELLEGGAIVRALGTEGSRLSWAQFATDEYERVGPTPQGTWMMQGELISPDAVRLVASASWGSEALRIEHRRGWLCFSDDETTIMLQLVSGLLPSEYRQVICHSPGVSTTRVRCDSKALGSLLQRVSIGMGKHGAVRVHIDGLRLEARGHSQDTGADMSDRMPVVVVDEPKTAESWFSPKLLLACLKPFGGQVTIEMGAPLDPLIIRPDGPRDERLAVIMPVRER